MKMREKWAGADLNCGYGHPKAEGYQATPPARICCTARALFNISGTRTLAGCLILLIPASIQVIVDHGDRLVRMNGDGSDAHAFVGDF